MAHQHFEIDRVAGSNSDPFTVQFVDNNGAGIDITGATVTFRMVERATLVVAIDDAAAAALAGTSGFAQYEPTVANVATSGAYWGEMTAVQLDGKVLRSGKIGHIIDPAL